MINVLIGNIFDSNAETLVNTVNCVGVMGKGIAKKFKKRYPDMYKQYKKKCERNEVKIGEPYLYKTLKGPRIILFPTKVHWRQNAKYKDIIKGLDIFRNKYKKWGIKSVAFPPLGCGNGGLDWSYIGPIMYGKLNDLDIDIELYAPYGTEKHQITEEFLNKKININKIKNNLRLKIKPEWIVILEIIRNLRNKKYTKPVGRTIFQKICFVADQAGIADFNFKKGSYGPFSRQIKPILATLANDNIIKEKQKGRMIELKLDENFQIYEKKYKNRIKENHDIINKISDLFQRIKNTEQAEEVTTVLWIEKELKKMKSGDITDSQVIENIIKWKPEWEDEEKLSNIYEAIINLNLLGWTNITIQNKKVKNYIRSSI
ncbi:MAG: macro domain-containing protein [Candidatus Thermoplasmatota archaeon]